MARLGSMGGGARPQPAFLRNTTPEIQEFTVHYGYNYSPKVPVVNGFANVPNVGLHTHLGTGVSFQEPASWCLAVTGGRRLRRISGERWFGCTTCCPLAASVP